MHLGWGNLSSGVFTVMALVPFSLTVFGEGLESLEKVSFASPVAVAGLQAEWSQFKDAMFATSSNSARRPYILTVEQRKRDVLKDKLACSEAQQSYPNILKLLMREQVTPAGSMEVR